MTFQRAPPEVNGFGVITSTPDFVRSGQSLSFFGFPDRVPITTTESVTKPLYWFWFQLASTMPAWTSLVMSGSSENSTTSAVWPACTARLCSPDPPYDWVKVMFLPVVVFWKALMIFSKAACGVEYETSASSAAGSGFVPDRPDSDAPAPTGDRSATATTVTTGSTASRASLPEMCIVVETSGRGRDRESL